LVCSSGSAGPRKCGGWGGSCESPDLEGPAKPGRRTHNGWRMSHAKDSDILTQLLLNFNIDSMTTFSSSCRPPGAHNIQMHQGPACGISHAYTNDIPNLSTSHAVHASHSLIHN